MLFDFKKPKIELIDTKVLILPIFKNNKFSDLASQIDKKLNFLISDIIKEKYWKPDLGQIHTIYSNQKLKIKKIVLLGLGDKAKITDEKYWRALSNAVSYLNKINITEIAVYLDGIKEQKLQNTIEIFLLSLYKFNYHKSQKNHFVKSKIVFLIDNINKETVLISKKSQIFANAINNVRDLVNHPSNIITPKKLSEKAKKFKNELISVKTYDEKELDKMGLRLFTSVSKGSIEDAQMIILDYKPKKYDKTISIIGKGLTFDAGGISLKPANKMDEMKMDMAGGAVVFGVFEAISKLMPKNVRVVGVIGACENLPGHNALKPGDIIKSYSGKTVEIINTDAEGRLVLADLISYIVDKYKPEYLIDIATLTGAIVIALGHEYIGLVGNDQKSIKKLIEISEKSYEKIWQLPIDELFHEEFKSDVADLNNVGNGAEGGASSAAAFLEEFVNPKTKWMHMDIGGSAIISKTTKAFMPKGGTGSGVKTLVEFIENLN